MACGAETAFAQRDGAYRMALYYAAAHLFPDAVRASSTLAPVVNARSLSPWAPVGPDGGVSGGLLMMHVITNDIAVCV